MKKKTKSKSNNNLQKTFLLSVFACILGASINSILFYNNFFQTLSKLNEEPIATITFKYKTAQRKFLERMIWDRLKQNSPLYNGDTVHTSPSAEATITFNDGNVMVLSESTMAQVFVDEQNSASARLSGGEAMIDSSNSNNGFSLSSGSTFMNLASGAQVNAATGIDADMRKGFGLEEKSSLSTSSKESLQENQSGKALIQVIKGEATVLTSSGEEKTVQEGQSIEVSKSAFASPKLSVKSPLPNQKIIYHTQGLCDVDFKWEAENLTPTAKLFLEISKDKSFKELIDSKEVQDLKDYSVSLEDGNYFWRLSLENSGEKNSLTGKFNLTKSLPPDLVAPAKDNIFTYRTKNPSVRFVWTDSPLAQNYKLEISDNEKMENPILTQRVNSTSSIISTLTEGKYFWQVTPYYKINNLGFAAQSIVHSFVIEKKGGLNTVEIFIPADSSLVDNDSLADKAYFSWKSDVEAEEYNFKASKNPDLSNPKVNLKTKENYVSLKAADFFEEGKWYWGVTFSDSEKNVSPSSAIRSFYSIKGKPSIRAVEPANMYQVSESLVQDLRFTWKKNLPSFYESEIRISTDEAMKNIIYRSKIEGHRLSELKLGLGTYYWNLVASASDSSLTIETLPSRFAVIGNLSKAELKSPLVRAVARETTPFKFEWDAVPDADSYKFEIYKDSSGEVVYTDTILGTSTQVDMFYGKGFDDKTDYRWTVQARANAIPGLASRRIGNIAEEKFLLLKLRPVEILLPAKNAQISGEDAILRPGKIKWDSVDAVEYAQLVLTKVDEKPAKVIIKTPSDEVMQAQNAVKIAPKEIPLDAPNGMQSGSYEVVVYAKTLDGIDISNTEDVYKGRFTILPIPKLETVTALISKPQKFDIDYLRNLNNKRSITLEWAKVPKATSYLVKVYLEQSRSKQTLLIEDEIEKNSYAIEFEKMDENLRAKFQRGNFLWTVQAIRRVDFDNDGINDKIFQTSEVSPKANFVTEVPEVRRTRNMGASNTYGKN
ncbi:FecR family protein [Treponema pectinovorum]|uniref:FecR domain-containing protein n=1 Tax=Treponema pectinovorum TaxID=164 RepID=UPI0011C8788D|nr:FecR domain-containing protein [Treponema pectinovorum]